jgi:hypothetical protein
MATGPVVLCIESLSVLGRTQLPWAMSELVKGVLLLT